MKFKQGQLMNSNGGEEQLADVERSVPFLKDYDVEQLDAILREIEINPGYILGQSPLKQLHDFLKRYQLKKFHGG
jgi:hypothetical protein